MKGRAMRGAFFALLAGISIALPSSAEEQFDLSRLSHGMMGVDIPSGPYYIIRRSIEEQEILVKKYGQKNLRSGHKDFMLIKAVSPDSDCALAHVEKGNSEYAHHPIYEIGGFLDLCSCAWFDLTGRRQSESCPGSDLEIAPHQFLHDEVVVIGE
ncbi:hypothetical protein [Marinimicrobium locisalis]|uniref:hypothetical protein n=1 Tax=Marinimicrobium locisalis TaxID=546022 RepID=UPI003221EB44